MQFPDRAHVALQKPPRFRPLRGRLWGVFNTPLQLGTCDPSKYRCDPLTGYVRGFKKWICIRHRRGRLWGVFNTPLQPGTCDPSKYRCNFPTEYMRSFEIPMRSPDWVRARVQKTDLYLPPSGPRGGRIQYAPIIGYVRSFEIPM